MNLEQIRVFHWNTWRREYMPIQYQLTPRPLVAVVSCVTSNFKCYRLPLQLSYCDEISIIRKKIKNSIGVGFFFALFPFTVHLFSGADWLKMRCIIITSLYCVKSGASNFTTRRASAKQIRFLKSADSKYPRSQFTSKSERFQKNYRNTLKFVQTS